MLFSRNRQLKGEEEAARSETLIYKHVILSKKRDLPVKVPNY